MLQSHGEGGLGTISVFTSTDGGHSPEQIADMALNRIMQVNETAPPVIRDQAIAHKDKLREVLIYYMHSMAKSERTTIWALMKKQGHEDIAEIIRRL
jgi:hypothetical protein|tara:strand:- start:142 stop:432 length:291 start_codon:yes stop_codon:yes gene_type:complete